MKYSENLYTSLCVLFSIFIVLGNIIYQKFVHLHVPFVHTFEISVGTILYPLTFLITDLIAEFFGKHKANYCVKMALLINIMVVGIIYFMDYLPATSWSKIDDLTFHNMFGVYYIAFGSSIVACYLSQTIDIKLYSTIRKLTKERFLWLRNIVSTSASLFIDTVVVIAIMSFFKIVPLDNMLSLIASSYSWKLFFTIFSSPIFCIIVFLLRKYYFHKKSYAL